MNLLLSNTKNEAKKKQTENCGYFLFSLLGCPMCAGASNDFSLGIMESRTKRTRKISIDGFLLYALLAVSLVCDGNFGARKLRQRNAIS